MYNYVYTTIYTDIHIDKYFNDTCWIPNQGHGHEKFLQGGGHGLWLRLGPGTGTKDGIKPTKHWIYSNQTGDTMVIDRGFLGTDGV